MPVIIKEEITVFLNAFYKGSSGGDMVFCQLASLLPYNFRVFTSISGREFCQRYKFSADYSITSETPKIKSIFLEYCVRTLKACIGLFYRSSHVLWASSDYFPDVIPCFLYKVFNPRVLWLQFIFHIIPKKRLLFSIIQEVSLFLIKYFADTIFVDSHQLENTLISRGFPAHKISVIYLGIRQVDKSLSDGTPAYDGVYIGRIKEAKGVFDLIPICQYILKKIPDFRLALIGEGSDKDKEMLASLIRENNLTGNFNYLGFLQDPEAFTVLANSKVFLFPSHEEGFGLVGVEAQSQKLPLVAWDLPIFSEIFPQGMATIPYPNYSQFGQKVVEILTDKTLFESMSVASYENSLKYNWEIPMQKVHNIIDSYLEKEKPL